MVHRPPGSAEETVAIAKAALQDLLDAVAAAGYTTVGPCIRDNSIAYEHLTKLEQLPQGYSTEQAPGRFRLIRAGHTRYFDFIPAAPSWKQFLFPPRQDILRFGKLGDEWQGGHVQDDEVAFAFIGVRACELAAIQMQDGIFMRSDFSDEYYSSRRNRVFILAVDCSQPAGTCFCATMGTGPAVGPGFDLCLTELEDRFLVRVGSALGAEVLQRIDSEPASAFHLGGAARALQDAATRARCEIQPETCAQDIMSSLEHPHWDEVAKRCLSCGNCTMACPTCFCWDVIDQISLSQTQTRRERIWDSCFSPSYAYQAGGNSRPTIKSRYRQWLSHKFGSWPEQYGSLGCVGCGRCITWCPAGIDTRVEVAAFQRKRVR